MFHSSILLSSEQDHRLTFRQIANPSVAALYEDALVYETGTAITATGALTAYSGAKTGRSPMDKRIVKEPQTEKEVWWGPVNKPMTEDVSIPSFSNLVAVASHPVLASRRLCGMHPRLASPDPSGCLS